MRISYLLSINVLKLVFRSKWNSITFLILLNLVKSILSWHLLYYALSILAHDFFTSAIPSRLRFNTKHFYRRRTEGKEDIKQ